MKKIRLFILICSLFIFWSGQAFSATLDSEVKYLSLREQLEPYKYVKIEGKGLRVDFDKDGVYKPYFIKGVGYSPYPIGRKPDEWNKPNIFNDSQILNRDFSLLQAMNCNTIRIWKGNDTEENGHFPLKLTNQTLDLADQYGLKVIAGFWINTSGPECKQDISGNYYVQYTVPDIDPQSPYNVRQQYINSFVEYVNNFKNHPAILFWAIGNENNYHLDPNNSKQIEDFYSLVNDMARAAHEAEGDYYHPVAFVNGDLGYIGEDIYGTDDTSMDFLDIWGANVYRGESFINEEYNSHLFNEFKSKSQEKPLWISEYGVDAWHVDDYFGNPENGELDEQTQAQIIGSLWNEIAAYRYVTIGATVMEYSDEWWKPIAWGQDSGTHDYDGTGPTDTSCPPDETIEIWPGAPDNFFNAEWWGIMAISRPNPDNGGPDIMTPRQVYYALQEKFTPLCGDANGDGRVNIGDAVYLINHVFKGGPAPEPLEVGDVNGDGTVDVGDAVYLINHVFKGGPAPVCE